MESKSSTLSAEYVRRHWREVLDDVGSGNHITVTRFGKPVAVFIPYHQYLAWFPSRDTLPTVEPTNSQRRK